MTGLNREQLEVVRAWAEKEIERIEIRRANAPMFDAVRGNSGRLMTQQVPEMMAGPIAAAREATLKLEKSMAEADERSVQAAADRQARLAQARAKTAALREWLEVVS